MESSPSRASALLEVVPVERAASFPRERSSRFRFSIPPAWRCPIDRNPHAIEAERDVLRWLAELGCTAAEIQRAEKFDIAGYVGMSFPLVSRESTVRLAKSLSMWLLWDDVQVEQLEDV
jgi:hypothetical protein